MSEGNSKFVGNRLREAREARGLGVSALAEVLGMDRSSIAKYERGTISPSADVVSRLAELLRVPASFLVKVRGDAAKDTLFYRSLSGKSKSDRLRSESKYGWVKDISAFVKGYVRVPLTNLPWLDVPLDPLAIDSGFIEAAAGATREHWGLGDGPISDMMLLAENNGIIVSRFSASSLMMDGYSGVDGYSGCAYVVLASDKGSAVRSRFDLAHEVGHLVLHRGLSAGFVGNPANNKMLENQAHAFAGAFLLPEKSFAEDVWVVSLDSLKNLKHRWLVSIGAMLYRCGNLEWLSESQQRDLWINYSRRGWKRQEPFDDVLEPEKPRILNRSLRMIVEKGGVPASRIVAEIGLFADDIEELAGLDHRYLGSLVDLEIPLDASQSRDLGLTEHYQLDSRRLFDVN